MTRGEETYKTAKCKHWHCSPMSNSRCDLNSKGKIMELHDKSPKSKCNCQKQITVTPKQFQLEGSGFRNKMAEIFSGTQTAWNKILKPAVSTLAPVNGYGRRSREQKSTGRSSYYKYFKIKKKSEGPINNRHAGKPVEIESYVILIPTKFFE